MKFKAEILSAEEVELIHSKTMDLLENTGVCIQSQRAFKMMKDAGVRVDEKTKRVYLTEEYVMEAVRRAPSRFMLAGRNRMKYTLLTIFHPSYGEPLMKSRTLSLLPTN